jgi:hypothetical protein
MRANDMNNPYADVTERHLVGALSATQPDPRSVDGHTMGMHCFLSTANGRGSIAHDRGTGGSSCFVALDCAAKRAVISLNDTALTSVGGFGTLGRHLLDPSVPLDAPRIVAMRGPQADRRAPRPLSHAKRARHGFAPQA